MHLQVYKNISAHYSAQGKSFIRLHMPMLHRSSLYSILTELVAMSYRRISSTHFPIPPKVIETSPRLTGSLHAALFL